MTNIKHYPSLSSQLPLESASPSANSSESCLADNLRRIQSNIRKKYQENSIKQVQSHHTYLLEQQQRRSNKSFVNRRPNQEEIYDKSTLPRKQIMNVESMVVLREQHNSYHETYIDLTEIKQSLEDRIQQRQKSRKIYQSVLLKLERIGKKSAHYNDTSIKIMNSRLGFDKRYILKQIYQRLSLIKHESKIIQEKPFTNFNKTKFKNFPKSTIQVSHKKKDSQQYIIDQHLHQEKGETNNKNIIIFNEFNQNELIYSPYSQYNSRNFSIEDDD